MEHGKMRKSAEKHKAKVNPPAADKSARRMADKSACGG
jgi:hypothetical protein